MDYTEKTTHSSEVWPTFGPLIELWDQKSTTNKRHSMALEVRLQSLASQTPLIHLLQTGQHPVSVSSSPTSVGLVPCVQISVGARDSWTTETGFCNAYLILTREHSSPHQEAVSSANNTRTMVLLECPEFKWSLSTVLRSKVLLASLLCLVSLELGPNTNLEDVNWTPPSIAVLLPRVI